MASTAFSSSSVARVGEQEAGGRCAEAGVKGGKAPVSNAQRVAKGSSMEKRERGMKKADATAKGFAFAESLGPAETRDTASSSSLGEVARRETGEPHVPSAGKHPNLERKERGAKKTNPAMKPAASTKPREPMEDRSPGGIQHVATVRHRMAPHDSA